jgi:nitroreductase
LGKYIIGKKEMDALETIRKRRSVREFSGDPLPKQALLKIIEAVRWAPSGYNRQPWGFIVVKEKSMINRLKIT